MPYIAVIVDRPVRVLALVVPLLVGVPGFSQTETPITPEYAEEIEVRVIDVDVVVTDRRGNPLTDLTREDFELYENGQRVDIDYFSRTVGGRIADLPPLPDEVAGVAAAPPDTIPRNWVIYIDQTNMAPQFRNQAMRQLHRFLARSLTREDRGLVALNDGRALRLRQGLTDDTKLLIDTVAKIQKERISVSPTKMQSMSILSKVRTSEDEAFAEPAGSLLVPRDYTEFYAQTSGAEISALIDQEAARTRAAIFAMNALLESLARMEGRLALVYVGAGFNTLPAGDLTEIWKARFPEYVSRSFAPRPEDQREPIEREITRLYDSLSALRVTVYAIHGGDPGGGPTSVEDRGQLDTASASSFDVVAIAESGTSREMADRTGGLYFKVNPSLDGQLDAVMRDLDNYYSLGYRPTGDPGQNRRVRVKVNVEGARARHRETVRERTRSEKAATEVVAAMVQPQQQSTSRRAPRIEPSISTAVATEANPLGVSIDAERPRKLGSAGEHFLSFNFSIELDALTFVPRGNERRAAFVMHFALVGSDGTVYPLESREQSLTVPAEELPASSNRFVSYSWHLDVVPLKIPEGIPARQRGMRLNVTVEDRYSGARSVITVPLGEQ